jgi:luciferase family oxidoreductase group 1
MKPPAQLGILDFGIIGPGKDPAEAMRETVQLAVLAESLGYSRYWLAEHHENFFAWACPEVLLPVVAEATRHIRIGPAGFLLNFYSPLKIAEIARVLQALYPSRFDLGIAAGLSEDPVRQALVPGFNLQHALETRLYGKKVVELFDYLRNRFPAGHRFERGATPINQPCPDVWLMGSGKGKGGMTLAISQGTSYSHSLFHGDATEAPITLQQYREGFRPSAELSTPRANIAIAVICAETELKACRQLQYIQYLRILTSVNVWGNPVQCCDQIQELQFRHGVNECVLIPAWESFADRARTYELLADVFDLKVHQDAASSNG